MRCLQRPRPHSQYVDGVTGRKVDSPAERGVSDGYVFGASGAHTQALTVLKPSCELTVSVHDAAVQSGECGNRVPSTQRRIAAQYRPPCCCSGRGTATSTYAIGASNQKGVCACREGCSRASGLQLAAQLKWGSNGWRRCAPSRVVGICAVIPLAPRGY